MSEQLYPTVSTTNLSFDTDSISNLMETSKVIHSLTDALTDLATNTYTGTGNYEIGDCETWPPMKHLDYFVKFDPISDVVICQNMDNIGVDMKINYKDKFTPKRIIKSGDRTIVFWKDDTKTIVKRFENAEDNDYSAFCAALAIKLFGNNSQVKKIVRSTEVQEKKKKKKKDAPSYGSEAESSPHDDGVSYHEERAKDEFWHSVSSLLSDAIDDDMK